MITRPYVAFYGDDFTGSTDALAQFHRFGLRSVLLLQKPTVERLRSLAEDHDAIGVAGVARSLATEELTDEIVPVLEAFRAVRPRFVQYKACSTMDSSPTLGSLGRAIEVGLHTFGTQPVPVLAAQPELGRYTAFATHFAREGDQIYRLDRQPTMATHPATPMTEADLRLVLGSQADLVTDSFALPTHELAHGDAVAAYRRIANSGADAVVLDALVDDHLRRCGRILVDVAGDGPPLFTLGSGGLSYALASAFVGSGAASPPANGRAKAAAPPAGAAQPVLVVSGSQAAGTAKQIRWALERGWSEVQPELDPTGRVATTRHAIARLRQEVLSALAGAPGVVVHSGKAAGPVSGPREWSLRALGEVLGHCVDAAVREGGVRRIVVAGGDTSGHVLGHLDVSAARVAGEVVAGAVLCRLDSPDPGLDGTEVLVKGGQIGPTSLFEDLRWGRDATEGGSAPDGVNGSRGTA